MCDKPFTGFTASPKKLFGGPGLEKEKRRMRVELCSLKSLNRVDEHEKERCFAYILNNWRVNPAVRSCASIA